MNRAILTKLLALSAVTGVRSMAGLAALASARGGPAKPALLVVAATEMFADKSPSIGNRIDPLPLGARALIGGAIGVLVAREAGERVVLGAVLGATTAVVATQIAYDVRRRLPVPSAAGGLLEDALVVAVASRYA
ncbi:hypothetical protein LuPra_05083 [Luteitalea pratensis]|uniref:DUF4126 domain-containing protein n=1 Tax=Luteitalea pratensis TaxID=1855912 RepID=A0A143PUG2_LUTPR|nr:hypothetical protein [Luteitalea pratensis]AMY11818.1 hypothetical protein LuPra_05083 [Luteitalea pratensis]